MRPLAICRKVRKDGESLQNYKGPGFLVVYSLVIMLNPFLAVSDVGVLMPTLVPS